MSVRSVRPIVWGALGYCAIGVASAVVTNPITARGTQTALRLAALALGGATFALHLRHEMATLGNAARRAASRVAAGAALGGFLLAGYMVAYNTTVRSRPFGTVALVLLVWPMVTGGLGYLAAILAGSIVERWRRRGRIS